MKEINLGYYIMSEDRKELNKYFKENNIKIKLLFDNGEIIIKTNLDDTEENIKNYVLSQLRGEKKRWQIKFMKLTKIGAITI